MLKTATLFIVGLLIPVCVSASPRCVSLSWIAPGDDGKVGTAYIYDIRYSLEPIDETNWADATQVLDEYMPNPAGIKEYFIVTGLTPETQYYFAIRTADRVGNWSEISNIVTGATGPDRCFGSPGNVNCDSNGDVNIVDLTRLIQYIFLGYPEDCLCSGAGDFNGNSGGKADISDLTAMINYLYKGGDPPVDCIP